MPYTTYIIFYTHLVTLSCLTKFPWTGTKCVIYGICGINLANKIAYSHKLANVTEQRLGRKNGSKIFHREREREKERQTEPGLGRRKDFHLLKSEYIKQHEWGKFFKNVFTFLWSVNLVCLVELCLIGRSLLD